MTGQFYDEAGLHVLNHRGWFFRVRGPLTASHTPQGPPLIVQAGASERELDLAGRFADLVYALPRDLAQGIRVRDDLRARAVKSGHAPGDIKVLPGIQVITGRTEAEAAEKYDFLKSLIHPVLSIAQLHRQNGDLVREETLDQPVPECPKQGE